MYPHIVCCVNSKIILFKLFVVTYQKNIFYLIFYYILEDLNFIKTVLVLFLYEYGSNIGNLSLYYL